MNSITALLLVLPVLLHGAGAGLSTRGARESAWRRAEWAAAAALAAGAIALARVLAAGPAAGYALRLDVPGATVLLLVGVLGWVVVRYSRRYLQGEAYERRYLRLLSATLAAVSTLLVADHLLLMAGAWIATGLTLNRLLRFYAERPAAQLAAHKKFLSGRFADASLLVAIALLGSAYGTLSIQGVLDAASVQGLPPLAQGAMLLLAVTALLKCAQMPLHGWLLQVMEAPTPVSALLHAGVVNLGGLVLIRLSPLLAQSPAAQWLLGIVAAVSLVLAAMVTSTRVSVKVMLAWSTVAQMGFMLLQIALGLPAMALVHLVAHSLYKAHAFLSASGAPWRQQVLRLVRTAPPSAPRWALATTVVLVTWAAALWLSLSIGLSFGPPAAWLAAMVLGMAMVPLLASGRLLQAAAVALMWLGGHALASHAIVASTLAAPIALVGAAAVSLALLFAWQAAVTLRPQAGWVQRLHPWAYGGFYVDEWVSRRLLSRWPVPAPSTGTDAFAVGPVSVEGAR